MPDTETAPSATPSSIGSPRTSPSNRSTRRILIVDDAPDLLMLLAMLLQREGYQVETAPDVARALEILDKQTVDLLITDWSMPVVDGSQLVSAVRRGGRQRDLPVIVLTGHDTDAKRDDALASGCDRYLVKPVAPDELLRIVSEFLNRHTRCGDAAPPSSSST